MDRTDPYEEDNTCWICLEGASTLSPLLTPCGCPRTAHRRCLAKWQVHSAGRSEETRCRFCNQQLPDWREAMIPSTATTAAPLLSVWFGGQAFVVPIDSGLNGLAKFKADVKKVLGIPDEYDFDASFTVRDPQTGEKVKLAGLNTYHAAAHYAALNAGQRAARQDSKPQILGASDSNPTPSFEAGGHPADTTAAIPPMAISSNLLSGQRLPLQQPGPAEPAPSFISGAMFVNNDAPADQP